MSTKQLMSLCCTLVIWLTVGIIEVKSKTLNLASTDDLANVLEQSQAGDIIVLGPGVYPVNRFNSRASGTHDLPITVTADPPHLAVIKATGQETFVIQHSYWKFEGLTIEGGPDSHHAFHLSDNADFVEIRNNHITDFHSHIKSNGLENRFPDHVLIEQNRLRNTTLRKTDQPTTPIDVVGGDGWVIRNNVVSDFGRVGRESVSYGIFLKGNSTNGLIEQNLVICSQNHAGGYRIGISLGGGGTGAEFCKDRSCNYEHRFGVIRNNVVINCSDAGIYLKRAGISQILHNTLLLTDGIDLREETTSAIIRNNYIGGVIQTHDGASLEGSNNITSGWGWFTRAEEMANYITGRISDYPVRYPGIFSQALVETLQGWVNAAAQWISESRLGFGRSQTLNDFPNLVLGDLAPGDPDRLSRAAAVIESVETDFWGHDRNLGKPYIGAIDYGVSGCLIGSRLSDEYEAMKAPCL